MENKIFGNRNMVRAQALVLVSMLIAAGSVAMAPAVFASSGNQPAPTVVSENIGDFTVTATEVTPNYCYVGSNIPVLQIDVTDNVGTTDNLFTLDVQYGGTDVADVTLASLWVDGDNNHIFNSNVDNWIDSVVPTGNIFSFAPNTFLNLGTGGTLSFWILLQTSLAATEGNLVYATIPVGGIVLQNDGANTVPFNPDDVADPCDIVSETLGFPQDVFGYLFQDDLTTPIAGQAVTFLEVATGETLVTTTDASGLFSFDLTTLNDGFTDGDDFELFSLPPNPAWNSGIIAQPFVWLDLTVDSTAPETVLSIAPDYDNTGGWNVDFTWTDPLVNAYCSGVETVDIYVETPTTPGIFNLWITETDPLITGSIAYNPSAGDGVYYFYSVATDYAGNVEPKAVASEDSIIFDTADPTSTVTGPYASDVLTFDVAYDVDDPGTAPSGVSYVHLYYSSNGGALWQFIANDTATGTFAGVTVPADGSYDWYTAAFDNAGNSETYPPTDGTFIEFTTIVDTADPVIGATTTSDIYFNSQGTFGGRAPPVFIMTEVTDDNLAAAGWGVRNDLQIGNATMYFTYDITNDVMPSSGEWDADYYFINNVLVTVTMGAAYGLDKVVFGELNGANTTGHEIGNNLPSHYAVFSDLDGSVTIYATHSSLDQADHELIPNANLNIGDTFTAYRYDEGAGYVVTASASTFNTAGDLFWVSLTEAPVPDGRYAVCVSAIDLAGNTAWTNETTGNPVIIIDNYAPDADATGPLTSNVAAFDITYSFSDPQAPNGATPSPIENVILSYQHNSDGWVNAYANDASPGDGLFSVDTSVMGGDGTYQWWMQCYDMAGNGEIVFSIEATTLVDTLSPTIGATTIDKPYINNQGTYGGIAPPVTVSAEAWDDNLAAAGWGVRNDLQIGNATMYFTYDITNDVMPSSGEWDADYYFINNVLVTVTMGAAYGLDKVVFGEFNGLNATDLEIGNNLPSHYAVFSDLDGSVTIYATHSSLDQADHELIPNTDLIVGDTFTAYRYDEGAGYVVTASISTFNTAGDLFWISLTEAPVPDGRYAVCVSAIDEAGNTAWTNETTGNPVITVDNFAPDADATGPAISSTYTFDVTYTYINDPLPSSGFLNLSLWMNYEGSGWIWFAEEPTLDGLFTVDVSFYGEGTYEWFMAAFDMTHNHEDLLFTAEATTLIDITDPTIGATTVGSLYINNEGTFDGTAPPVMITASAADANLAAAAWGIRDYMQLPSPAMYFTYDLGDGTESTNGWDGNQYFINGVLVTVTMGAAYGLDKVVFGELNGANTTGHEIGNNLPSHYAVFSDLDGSVTIYATHSSIDQADHELIPNTDLIVGDTFTAYRYDEGAGYVVTASISTFNTAGDLFWVSLTEAPVPEGRYAVCVSAIDMAGNDAWMNETLLGGSIPFITVDNTQPTYSGGLSIVIDMNGNGEIDTGDTIRMWVNVTDMNEDGTCPLLLDVDEDGYTDQPVVGPIYGGFGSWSADYVVQGPGFTQSNVDLSYRDLAGNLVEEYPYLIFDVWGDFIMNYNAGWNLFGIPVSSPTIAGVAIEDADDLSMIGALMVSKWNFATQRYINYIPGFHTPLDPQNFPIAEDEAYWAWMPTAGSIAINGCNPGARTVSVNGPGWNMIGYMDPVNMGDIGTDWAPSVSCGLYDDIAYYDAGTFVHYVFPGTMLPLESGRGYFVWSDFPTNIDYAAAAWNANSGQGFQTIQAAIDNADPYDTINVEPGIHYEQLVITKPLTLNGAGSGILSAGSSNKLTTNIPKPSDDATIIDGSGGTKTLLDAGGPLWEGSTIAILSDEVEIYGVQVSNSGNAGIFLYYVESCYIQDVLATNNQDGFDLYFSNDNDITECEANSNYGYGIYAESSEANTIEYNTVEYNYVGIGLSTDSNSNTINSNTVGNNNFGICLDLYSNDNHVDYNTVSSNANYGLYLHQSNNNNIVGNDVSFNMVGTMLENTAGNVIYGNTISDNYAMGIRAYQSSWTQISSNTINSNPYGIYLDGSTDSNIISNAIEMSMACGIYITSDNTGKTCGNIIITDNLIANGMRGIHLEHAVGGAFGAIIQSNDFVNNMDYSVYVTFAIAQIYMNNFIGMPMAPSFAFSYNSGLPVMWDVAGTGNYWQGWTPPTPYVPDGGSGQQDSYPSFGPF